MTSGGTAASGFTADLTITPPFTPDANDKLCREYNFGNWDCAADSFTATTITRQNVTSFSDWAVGNDVGPTSIRLTGTAVSPATNMAGWLLLLAAMLGGVTAVSIVVIKGRGFSKRPTEAA